MWVMGDGLWGCALARPALGVGGLGSGLDLGAGTETVIADHVGSLVRLSKIRGQAANGYLG